MIHHCVANVLDQTLKLIGIPDIVEETQNLPLLSQENQISMGVFQFPSDPRTLLLALNVGKYGPTVSRPLSLIPPFYHRQRPVRGAIQQVL